LDFKITTVFFLLFSSFIRLIILGQGDYSCLQYIHFPVSKKTILLSHILINLMNPVWMLIILWITIIGFKESFLNREWISFLIWMVQISLISIMFEMGIMLVTQVFKKKNLPEFLLSSIILSFYWIISSMVFLFKCNEIIRIGILISLAIPFVFRFLHSMQQVLLLDFHEWRCGCSGKWISMKWFGLNNTYFPLQFQILNRNHGLRNDCALGILIYQYSFISLLSRSLCRLSMPSGLHFFVREVILHYDTSNSSHGWTGSRPVFISFNPFLFHP
jgi:hypothetical protein